MWTKTSGCDSGTPLRRGALRFGSYLPSLAREEALAQALRPAGYEETAFVMSRDGL